MGDVVSVKIHGYKAFLQFADDNITVYVNSQSQFKAGQNDAYGEGAILTKQQAEYARTVPGVYNTAWSVKDIKKARKWLQVNGFDVEKE